MKRMVLLALMLAVLCAGCTLENGTPEPGSEMEQSISQEEVSESGPRPKPHWKRRPGWRS